MMCGETQWEQLKMYAKAQSSLTNAHRELWQMKYELVKDMNSIIDQAKFLSDVQEYWPDVQECVSFETSDISRELSIVSDDTRERLKHSLAVRQTAREQQPKEVEVVVPTQGFALVN
jgi:DNA polymerase III sliding clamp (beta) subunit (PCNA family)